MLWTKIQIRRRPARPTSGVQQMRRPSRQRLVQRQLMRMVRCLLSLSISIPGRLVPHRLLISTCIPDGWGSSNQGGGTWAPETSETQEATTNNMFQSSPEPSATAAAPEPAAAVKREQPASGEMEAHVAEGDDTAVWFMERVCVQLNSDSRPAVIKEINSDKTAVVTFEDGSTETVRVDEVSRVQPKEKDVVLVISGADVGVEGELVCIDGSDAILRDPNEDFKIVEFVHLAKISGDS